MSQNQLGGLGMLSSAYAMSSSSEEDELDEPVEMTHLESAKPLESQHKHEENKSDEVAVASASKDTLLPMDFTHSSEFSEVKIGPSVVEEDDLRVIGEGEAPTNHQFKGEAYQEVQIKQEPPSSEEEDDGTSDSEPDSEKSNKSEDEDEEEDSGKKEPPRVKGELTYDDLPPIEDLHISVPQEQAEPVGVIKSFVDPLVLVEAYKGTVAVDLDSVLFLDKGDRALGHVFDVIGPVKQPIYCVRFNSLDHINKQKIEVGEVVYYAPDTQYFTPVFLKQLQEKKGTDASWLDDIEPPAGAQEFSDDEAERAAKRKGKKRKGRKVAAPGGEQNGEEPSIRYTPAQVPGFGAPPFRYAQQRWRGNQAMHQSRPFWTPSQYPSYPQFQGRPPTYQNQFQPQPPRGRQGNSRERGWGNNFQGPPRWPHPHVQAPNWNPNGAEPPPPGC